MAEQITDACLGTIRDQQRDRVVFVTLRLDRSGCKHIQHIQCFSNASAAEWVYAYAVP